MIVKDILSEGPWYMQVFVGLVFAFAARNDLFTMAIVPAMGLEAARESAAPEANGLSSMVEVF